VLLVRGSQPPWRRAGQIRNSQSLSVTDLQHTGACSGRVKGRKDFFFEEKKQKTFDYFGCGLSGEARPRLAKVLPFFSEKKNRFLPCLCCQASPDAPSRASLRKNENF
jgi:hypothetical protein